MWLIELLIDWLIDWLYSQYEVKFDIPERILFMALESVLYDEDQVEIDKLIFY